MSALRTGCLYLPGNIDGTHFCYRLSQPQGHSAAGRIMSTKNSNDSIGNRSRDLPACSAVPQPTALPRAPTGRKVQTEIEEEGRNIEMMVRRINEWRRRRKEQGIIMKSPISRPVAASIHYLRSIAMYRMQTFKTASPHCRTQDATAKAEHLWSQSTFYSQQVGAKYCNRQTHTLKNAVILSSKLLADAKFTDSANYRRHFIRQMVIFLLPIRSENSRLFSIKGKEPDNRTYL